MRSKVFAFVLVYMVFGAVAHAKPKMVATPLNSAGNVPQFTAEKLGVEFDTILSEQSTLVSKSKATAALEKLKLPKACETIKCGQRLAKELGVRFVLFTGLKFEDDTYTVSLKLYDASGNGFVSEAVENCDFCASREVKGTFAKAWMPMVPLLSKPPAKKKEEVKEAGPVTLSILTIPPGATVKLDGKQLDGESPIDVEVKSGEHTIEASLEGYVSAKRTVSIKDQPVKLPVIELIKTADLAADQTPVTPNKTSSIYGLSFGMLIGGSIIAGTGLWLIAKDGTLTCNDGRDRRSCPEVFNTKYLGYTAGALGGALIGAGSALFIKDYLDTRKAEEPAVTVLPSVTQDGAHLGLVGAF